MTDRPGSVSSPLIGWASRTAGAIGIVTSVLYLGLILGEGDSSQIGAVLPWFVVMLAAGVLAWFADRARPGNDRRLIMVAGVLFLGLGVLSILSIGVLYLAACLLSVFALSGKSSTVAGTGGNVQ